MTRLVRALEWSPVRQPTRTSSRANPGLTYSQRLVERESRVSSRAISLRKRWNDCDSPHKRCAMCQGDCPWHAIAPGTGGSCLRAAPHLPRGENGPSDAASRVFLLFLVHTRHATPPRAIVFTTIPNTNLAAKAMRLASAPRMTVTIAACAILSALFLLPTRANVQSSLCII